MATDKTTDKATVDTDPKEIVRQGYNAIADLYMNFGAGDNKYKDWLDALKAHLQPTPSSRVLDIGCGSGRPVARTLVAAGHRVVGVDISDVQIEKARENVPTAEFIRGDATTLEFDDASFDAVVSFYTFIHLPLEEQLPLLKKVSGWLKPGGVFVATVGHEAWTGTMPDWLGGKTLMWWSQADAGTYEAWLKQVGLEVREQKFIPEGDTGHTYFWAVKTGESG